MFTNTNTQKDFTILLYIRDNMKIYICGKSIYEQELKEQLCNSVILYPEIEVQFNDWLDYFVDNINNESVIVTQSSELLKYVDVAAMECDVYIWEQNQFVMCDKEAARLQLLGCYESLLIKGYLFND